jgi:hypothetical protein
VRASLWDTGARDCPARRRDGRSGHAYDRSATVSLFGIIIVCMLIVVVVGTLVDIFRRHFTTLGALGWVALVLLLPFLGSLIYWVVRKPEPADAEGQYLLEAEQRRAAARRPFDSTGTGP